MRTHSLINGVGQEFNLTDSKLIFHTTTGYGFERDDQVRRIGSRWIRVTKEPKPLPISGVITFYGENPYGQYKEFVQFSSIDPLVLCYTPEQTMYKKDVYISSLGKGEINKYGGLDVQIEFSPLTPWYREITVYTGDDNAVGRGFTFPVRWPVIWRSTESMIAEVISDSFMDSPCRITIEGPIKDPKWRHYVNGNYEARGDIDYEIAEGNNLVIDTISIPSQIFITDKKGNQIANVYQHANFGTERFIYLKNGKNTISLSARESAEKVPIKVEARLYYESV